MANNEVELDRKAMDLLRELVEEMRATRRTIEALAEATGLAHKLPDLIKAIEERERVEAAAAKEQATRHRLIRNHLSHYNGPDGPPRRVYLQPYLDQHPEWLPLTDEDVANYRLG